MQLAGVGEDAAVIAWHFEPRMAIVRVRVLHHRARDPYNLALPNHPDARQMPVRRGADGHQDEEPLERPQDRPTRPPRYPQLPQRLTTYLHREAHGAPPDPGPARHQA